MSDDVRDGDPISSHEGAGDNRPRRMNQRMRLLAVFEDAPDGLTATEAGYAALLERSCYWKRVSELQQRKLLESRTGPDLYPIRRMNEHSGSKQIVWYITPAGREALRNA